MPTIAEIRDSWGPEFSSAPDHEIVGLIAQQNGTDPDYVRGYLGLPEQRGGLMEFGRQLVGGAAATMPKMINQAGQAFSPAGSGLEQTFKENADYWKDSERGWAPDMAGRSRVAKGFIEAAGQMAPSLAVMGTAMIPGAGPYAAAGMAMAGFGGAQFTETYEKALTAGIPKDQAFMAALKTGGIEGFGETVGDLMGAKFLKGGAQIIEKMFGQGGLDAAIALAKDPAWAKRFAKDFAGNAAVQSGTEFGQGYGEALVEKNAGISQDDPMEQGLHGAEIAGYQSLIMGPLGLRGHARAGAQRGLAGDLLNNPAAPQGQRQIAADFVATDVADRGTPRGLVASWRESMRQGIVEDADARAVAQHTTLSQGDSADLLQRPAFGLTPSPQGDTAPEAAPFQEHTGFGVRETSDQRPLFPQQGPAPQLGDTLAMAQDKQARGMLLTPAERGALLLAQDQAAAPAPQLLGPNGLPITQGEQNGNDSQVVRAGGNEAQQSPDGKAPGATPGQSAKSPQSGGVQSTKKPVVAAASTSAEREVTKLPDEAEVSAAIDALEAKTTTGGTRPVAGKISKADVPWLTAVARALSLGRVKNGVTSVPTPSVLTTGTAAIDEPATGKHMPKMKALLSALVAVKDAAHNLYNVSAANLTRTSNATRVKKVGDWADGKVKTHDASIAALHDSMTKLLEAADGNEKVVQALVGIYKTRVQKVQQKDTATDKFQKSTDFLISRAWQDYKDGALSAGQADHIRKTEVRLSKELEARGVEDQPLVKAATEGSPRRPLTEKNAASNPKETGLLGVINYLHLHGTAFEQVLTSGIGRVLRAAKVQPKVAFLTDPEATSYYDPKTDTVWLQPKSTPEVAIHEALHAALQWYVYNNWDNNDTHINGLRAALKKLLTMSEQAKKFAVFIDEKGKERSLSADVISVLKKMNEKDAVLELISYGTTLRDFRNFMKTVEGLTKADLEAAGVNVGDRLKLVNALKATWQKLVALVDRMLGVKNMLANDVLQDTIGMLGQAQSEAGDREGGGKGKKLQARFTVPDVVGTHYPAYSSPERSLAEKIIKEGDNDARAFMDDKGNITHAFSAENLVHENVAKSLGWKQDAVGTKAWFNHNPWVAPDGSKYWPVYLEMNKDQMVYYRNDDKAKRSPVPNGAFVDDVVTPKAAPVKPDGPAQKALPLGAVGRVSPAQGVARTADELRAEAKTLKSGSVKEMTLATFAHRLAEVTGKKETIKQVLATPGLTPALREKMMAEAVRVAAAENRRPAQDQNKLMAEITTPDDTFRAVQRAQRFGEGIEGGVPEALGVSFAYGGQMQRAMEHVGDLVHRAAMPAEGSGEGVGGGGHEYGLEALREKVGRALRQLKDTEADGLAQIERNAAFREKEGEGKAEDILAKAKAQLEEYSAAYAQIPVHTELQRLGRDAAVALGRMDWAAYKDNLTKLQEILNSKDAAAQYAAMEPPEGGALYAAVTSTPLAPASSANTNYSMYAPTQDVVERTVRAMVPSMWGNNPTDRKAMNAIEGFGSKIAAAMRENFPAAAKAVAEFAPSFNIPAEFGRVIGLYKTDRGAPLTAANAMFNFLKNATFEQMYAAFDYMDTGKYDDKLLSEHQRDTVHRTKEAIDDLLKHADQKVKDRLEGLSYGNMLTVIAKSEDVLASGFGIKNLASLAQGGGKGVAFLKDDLNTPELSDGSPVLTGKFYAVMKNGIVDQLVHASRIAGVQGVDHDRQFVMDGVDKKTKEVKFRPVATLGAMIKDAKSGEEIGAALLNTIATIANANAVRTLTSAMAADGRGHVFESIDELHNHLADKLEAQAKEAGVPFDRKEYLKRKPVQTLDVGKRDAKSGQMDSYYRRPGEWVRVPNSKQMGDLSGKIISGPLWAAIMDASNRAPLIPFAAYNMANKAFKSAVTVYNPMTTIGNFLSNFVFAHMNNIPYKTTLKGFALYSRYLVHPESLTPVDRQMMAEFHKSGGILGDWSTAEVRELLYSSLQENTETHGKGVLGYMMQHLSLHSTIAKKGLEYAKKAGMGAEAANDFMTTLYAAGDNMFRVGAFMAKMGELQNEGMGKEAAIRIAGVYAKDVYLDYDIDARAVKVLKQTLLPFVSFTYASSKRYAEVAKNTPWKLAEVALAFHIIVAAAGAAFGGGDSDEEDKKKRKRDKQDNRTWFGAHSSIRLPSAPGKTDYLELARWLPTPFTSKGQPNGFLGFHNFPQSLTPNGLALGLGTAAFGVNLYTGKSLYKETDTDAQRFEKTVLAMGGSVVPGWVRKGGPAETGPLGHEPPSAATQVVSRFVAPVTEVDNQEADYRQRNQLKFIKSEFDKGAAALKKQLGTRKIDGTTYREKLADLRTEQKRRINEAKGIE